MTSYQGSEQHRENVRKAADLGRAAQTANREKRIAAYNLDPRRCPGCDVALSYDDVTKRKKKFCSSSCSAKVANARRMASGSYHSEATKEKIGKALTKHGLSKKQEKARDLGISLERACEECKKLFIPKKRIKTSQFCGKLCLQSFNRKKFQSLSLEELDQIRERSKISTKKQMEEGRWKGWSGRGSPSFPETFVMNLLESNGFTFTREKQCAGFSIDLAFETIMVALEVDGKQHDYPENAERDRRKEAALAEHGWTVVRLRWHNVRTKAGHQRVMEQYGTIRTMLEKLLKKSSPKCKNIVANVGESR